MTREEAVAALENIGDGFIDVSLRNGLIRSSKEMYKAGEGVFHVLHEIDGTMTEFTFDEAVEVLTGERSPWDGTVLEDDFEDEDDEE